MDLLEKDPEVSGDLFENERLSFENDPDLFGEVTLLLLTALLPPLLAGKVVVAATRFRVMIASGSSGSLQ